MVGRNSIRFWSSASVVAILCSLPLTACNLKSNLHQALVEEEVRLRKGASDSEVETKSENVHAAAKGSRGELSSDDGSAHMTKQESLSERRAEKLVERDSLGGKEARPEIRSTEAQSARMDSSAELKAPAGSQASAESQPLAAATRPKT